MNAVVVGTRVSGSLNGSVGLGGFNNPEDVGAVQVLLKKRGLLHTASQLSGIPLPAFIQDSVKWVQKAMQATGFDTEVYKRAVSKVCDPFTVQAIKLFQAGYVTQNPGGLIQPGDETWRRLSDPNPHLIPRVGLPANLADLLIAPVYAQMPGYPNVDRFVDNYKRRHGDFSNTHGQQLNTESERWLRVLIENIIAYYKSKGKDWFNPHVAYMLATARHETLKNGMFFKPVTESGGMSYFNKYDPVLAATAALRQRATQMENTQQGDGYKYRGRGYVQLTWKVNYRKCGDHLGVDLVNTPDLALQPETASGCMTYGMFGGIFTGRKITNYINGEKKDYFNARRVINGVDCADTIKGYAEIFEEILEGAM
jgi:hypothetical protein